MADRPTRTLLVSIYSDASERRLTELLADLGDLAIRWLRPLALPARLFEKSASPALYWLEYSEEQVFVPGVAPAPDVAGHCRPFLD
ncbi:hypothetical protein SprV_0100339700 [Sparganum proliferum]